MTKYLLLPFCLLLLNAHAQDRSEVWFGAGVKSELVKDLMFGVQTNARVRTDGRLQTLFQEVSIKSEHIKWFRPSVDYRFIASYAKNGNTDYGNRINLNADFRHKFGDVKTGVRGRYQLFLGNALLTGTDLDPSFRIKPYVEYTIPKTRFTPEVSAEFFYNPQNGPTGDRFNRIRLGLSLGIDLPGPNTLGLTYYYGKRFNTGNPYNEHIFSLEYSYEFKKDKDKKKKSKPVSKSKSIRSL